MRREYPSHPLLGVSALVIDKGRVLLVRRASDPGKGLWSLPGGLVEVGESLKDAVLRELKEESGIVGDVKRLLDVGEYIERDERGSVRYHYVLLVFLVEPRGGTPRPASDVLEVAYVTLDEALNMPLTKTTRKVLSALRSSRGPLEHQPK